MRTRRLFFSWLHRWVALTFGVWIALQGLTGATLVWHFELDAWLNPTWFSASRQGCTLPDQPISRALHVFEQATGGARPSMVIAPETPGAPFIVRQQLPSGMHRQHFIDAACAQYLGSRDWGAPHADRPHLIPALYEIHRSLLGGDGGRGLVGIAGLALLGLLVSGVWLAWPRCQGAARGWHAVLSVKRNGSLQRRCFDLHRASGLWLLPFLLLMCITGAYLCFPQPSRALVAAVLPTWDTGHDRRLKTEAALPVDPRSPDELVAAAERFWLHAHWTRLQWHQGDRPQYEVRLLQRDESRAHTGDTRVRFDAAGRVVAVRDALQPPPGERVLGAMFPLHSAEALGLVARTAWSFLGLAPALLFGTGAWLWARRRRRSPEAESRPRQTILEGSTS